MHRALLQHKHKSLLGGTEWDRDVHGFAIDEPDRKYSYQNLWKTWLGLALVRSKYHCTQYAAAVLEKAGLRFPYPATPEKVGWALKGAADC